MKKKIWILLPALLVVTAAAIAAWCLSPRPQASIGLESSDYYATSVEISSPPAPPKLQEGQYLLVHEAETESITVSKNMVHFSLSAFSYTSPHDQSSHETRSNRWILSISSQETENGYRISMKQTETSTRFEDRHPVEIVPTDPAEFTFLLNNNVLSWEDDKLMEETKPVSSQAYFLLQHVLSGAIYSQGDQSWSISPFF